MVLYINACVRNESRTDRIARALLGKITDKYDEIKLSEIHLQPLSEEELNKRTAYIKKGEYSNPMFAPAKQFADAGIIVIAAPYWDMSFPASLKVYLENIYVTGIVSEYDPDGKPHGLCKAKRLYYVTTSGGPYVPNFSYDYIKNLAYECFGIKDTELIKAEMLDVVGFDAEEIVEKIINEYIGHLLDGE